MFKNISPVMTELLSSDPDLLPLTIGFTVFDQTYCPLMSGNKNYEALAADPWDRYRNLYAVWDSDVCRDKFSAANTLLIDSDDTKV